MGVLAGIAGTLVVYPIDSVKTRLQNQKTTGSAGEMMYTGYKDCLQKVIKYEGWRALYNGLGAQVSFVILYVFDNGTNLFWSRANFLLRFMVLKGSCRS